MFRKIAKAFENLRHQLKYSTEQQFREYKFIETFLNKGIFQLLADRIQKNYSYVTNEERYNKNWEVCKELNESLPAFKKMLDTDMPMAKRIQEAKQFVARYEDVIVWKNTNVYPDVK